MNLVSATDHKFLGKEFSVSVRKWERKLFTMQWLSVPRLDSGTDFEHYRSFDEAHDAGVCLGRAAIAETEHLAPSSARDLYVPLRIPSKAATSPH